MIIICFLSKYMVTCDDDNEDHEYDDDDDYQLQKWINN